jgi:kojibiose phosphorylase
VIEQFDGYFALENVDVPKVKKRIKHPSEYWGGPEGVAAPTQVIRQADVALMLALFRHEYTTGSKRPTGIITNRRPTITVRLSPVRM